MSDCTSKRSENHKERRLNWSDIPYDVLECIIRHLGWRERFRMRAVCKAWSVPSRHIPAAAVDKFQIPWALKRSTYQLFDPFSGEKIVGGKEGRRVIDENFFGRPGGALTSMYGWFLFRNYEAGGLIKYSLYSPFTSEIIKLPDWKERPFTSFHPMNQVSGFTLNATSPKCVVFLLSLCSPEDKIYVWLCSPGDHSWRRIVLNSGMGPGPHNDASSAVYANGVFYCVFFRGELGAFNVELEEWTILGGPVPPLCFSVHIHLILIDADFWVFDQFVAKLYRFVSSEKRWVYQEEF
ncbi:hypothetical protein V6N13_129159 [Hibiscus sabdariffa]|uniref:F-box domain-containing protein n=1 Tax=Hibiscus sabdariffa TaxID=183260 RepID=A0ABR2SKB1_9ROSI